MSASFTESGTERAAHGQVVLAQRLRDSLARLDVPSEVAATSDWAIRSTCDVLVERAVGNAVVTYYMPSTVGRYSALGSGERGEPA